jgi:hypothetical protein
VREWPYRCEPEWIVDGKNESCAEWGGEGREMLRLPSRSREAMEDEMRRMPDRVPETAEDQRTVGEMGVRGAEAESSDPEVEREEERDEPDGIPSDRTG